MTNDELFPSAAPDFSDPLGLLRACHDRILRNCETLERLADHVADEGVDAEVRKAAGQVYRYFTTAGRLHHQDEEEDLFPRLARQSLKLADIIHALRQDHERLDALWADLEAEVERPAAITDPSGFRQRVAALATAYREHIRKENDDLLEMAQHILGPDELRRIGSAMSERRGGRPGV